MRISTILQVCQDAADDLTLARPATLFPAQTEGDEGDTSNRKLLRALTKTCEYLQSNFDWQASKAEYVYKTMPGEQQTNMLPPDFDRWRRQGYMYNRTRRWKLRGPDGTADWQNAKMYGGAAPLGQWRQIGDVVHIYPAPSAGEVLVFDYIRDALGTSSRAITGPWQSIDDNTARLSPSWVSIDQAPQVPAIQYLNRFSADTDKTLWPDKLVTLGIVYFYRENEGFDYAKDEAKFQRMYHDVLAEDGGRQVFDMTGERPSHFSNMRDAGVYAALSVPSTIAGNLQPGQGATWTPL